MISLYLIVALFFPSFKLQSVTYTFTVERNASGFHLYSSFLSTEKLCLGTPYQCLPIQFDPATSITVILNKANHPTNNSNRGNVYYDKTKSQSFYPYKSYIEMFGGQKMLSGSLSADNLEFGPLKMINSTFFLANETISHLEHSSIGISCVMNDEAYPSFISKLSRMHLIKQQLYLLQYDDDTAKGKIIFGNYSFYIKEPMMFELKYQKYFVSMYFKVKQLLFDNRVLGSDNHFIVTIFDETFRFIQMPSEMKKSIYDYYLVGENCEERTYIPGQSDETEGSYLYYLCPREVKKSLSLFNNITFRFEEGKVVLKNEDLFAEYDNDRVILNIIFKMDYSHPQWIIGHPLLKNYYIGRDLKNDRYFFYLKENKKKSSMTIKFYLILVVNLFLSLSVLCIGFVYLSIKTKQIIK